VAIGIIRADWNLNQKIRVVLSVLASTKPFATTQKAAKITITLNSMAPGAVRCLMHKSNTTAKKAVEVTMGNMYGVYWYGQVIFHSFASKPLGRKMYSQWLLNQQT